jgi:glycosyltransferase involved in cell wall biosynthesis
MMHRHLENEGMDEKMGTVPGLSDFGQSTVIVVIPAFNEERLIGSVVLKILCYPVTVIVVDDGSADLTADLAARAGAQVVCLPENQGKGAALNAGVQKALAYDPDAVVLIDADGQHLPGELPVVLAPVLEGRADIAIGSRYINKGSKVPVHRILGHKFFNFITGAASGMSISDSQCGYRAFSRRALDEINFSSTGFSVESEMQFWAHEKHLVVEEVPVTIQYIDKPKRPVMRQGMEVLSGVIKFTGQYRPLLYFGGTGGVVMFSGVIIGLRFVRIFFDTSQLALGSGLASVLLSIVGMILISTGFILHSVRGLLIELLGKH